MGRRFERWMQSDLIGVFATIVVVVLVALAIAIYFFVGAVAGLIFGVVLVGLTFYAISKTSRGSSDISDIAPPRAETAQRVLVIANRGLESTVLADELARRAEQGPLEVKLLAPVAAPSWASKLADDIDAEAAQAQKRVHAAVRQLSDRGVSATGSVDKEAQPSRSLLDGLREFPADEVLIVPGAERNWDKTEDLSDRIRAETDIRITELS